MATTTGSVEAEILDLERRYWQAMREQDVRTPMSLTEFPCLIAGASGVRSVNRATYEKMMTGGSCRSASHPSSSLPGVMLTPGAVPASAGAHGSASRRATCSTSSPCNSS